MCKQREREALPAPRAHSLATRAVPKGMSAPGAHRIRMPGGFGPVALFSLHLLLAWSEDVDGPVGGLGVSKLLSDINVRALV